MSGAPKEIAPVQRKTGKNENRAAVPENRKAREHRSPWREDELGARLNKLCKERIKLLSEEELDDIYPSF